MQGRSGKFSVFFIVLGVCLVLLLLSRTVFFQPIRGTLEEGVIALQKLVTGSEKTDKSLLATTQAENQTLKTQLAKQQLILQENQALRDQFAKSEENARTLLPASVISHRVSDQFLLDKGQQDGVKKGQAVILQDNLVGVVIEVTPHIAKVELTTSPNFSVAGQTVQTNAVGVSHGNEEDGILFEKVLLSDKLQVNDFVATKGDSEDVTMMLPPNLIIGKIISFDKKSSALYQTAKVLSLIDFTRLRTVFIQLQN